MKFYQAEMDLFEFAECAHSLKEWADYGINCVEFNGVGYWDGLEEGWFEIENPDLLCELDYFGEDEDGYKIAYLKEAK